MLGFAKPRNQALTFKTVLKETNFLLLTWQLFHNNIRQLFGRKNSNLHKDSEISEVSS